MTDPTADAAKLLPCPFCGELDGVYSEATGPHSAVARCSNCNAVHCENTEAEAVAKWNTRPQPAPPEGEPDFAGLVCQFCTDNDLSHYGVFEGKLINLAARMYRLGLSARPKVENAEAVLTAANVREWAHSGIETRDNQLNAAADLLERLARDARLLRQLVAHIHLHMTNDEDFGADEVERDLRNLDGGKWIDTETVLISERQRREAAEASLAAHAAELAKNKSISS